METERLKPEQGTQIPQHSSALSLRRSVTTSGQPLGLALRSCRIGSRSATSTPVRHADQQCRASAERRGRPPVSGAAQRCGARSAAARPERREQHDNHAPNANGAPPLDSRIEAIEELRKLHHALGEILAAVENGHFDDELWQNLQAGSRDSGIVQRRRSATTRCPICRPRSCSVSLPPVAFRMLARRHRAHSEEARHARLA